MKGSTSPNGLGSMESGKEERAAMINPQTNPANPANNCCGESRPSRLFSPRMGRVVRYGVNTRPANAPTSPNVNVYCSTLKDSVPFTVEANCTSEEPQ